MGFFKKSIVRVLIAVLMVVFLGYNLTVLVVMHKNIVAQFSSNLQSEVVSQSTYFLSLFDEERQKSQDAAELGARFMQGVVEGDALSIPLLQDLEQSCIAHSGVHRVLFFDKDSNFLIQPADWAGFEQNYATAAMQSRSSVSEILNYGGYIVAMSSAPAIVNNEVVGAVSTTKILTVENIVNAMKTNAFCDASIFTEYVIDQTTFKDARLTEIEDKTIIDRVMAGEEVTFTGLMYGQEYVSHYFALKDSNGNPVTTLYIGRALSSIRKISNKIFLSLSILLNALFLGFVVIFLILTNRALKKPLNNLEKQVENLASGEIDLNARMEISGQNEFARIGNYVNQFIINLQNIVKTLNETQTQITEIGEKLHDTSQDSASATTEILANINGINKQSQDQAMAVNDTSDILTRSAESVETLNEMIAGQVEDVSESSAAIEEMIGNIESVTTSVHKMAQNFTELETSVEVGDTKLKNLEVKVNEIASQSEMLKDANSIISNIARQTNLLAMNAAIEAAHAGEAGKGFSVVADEIRKLAETSSVQSKNISTELKTISSSIGDVANLSKDSQVTFGEIVNHIGSTTNVIKEIDTAMNEQHEASRLILKSLEGVKTKSSLVEDKSVELRKGVERVTGNMEQVKVISASIVGSMDEMTRGASQIGDSSHEVSDLASETKNQLDVMSGLLASFKN